MSVNVLKGLHFGAAGPILIKFYSQLQGEVKEKFIYLRAGHMPQMAAMSMNDKTFESLLFRITRLIDLKIGI